MPAKLLAGIVLSLVSVSCAAQVVPAATRPGGATALGGGFNYSSADWGAADINRFGPNVWAQVTIWHDLSLIAEGHSMIWGGNKYAPLFKYYAAGGGLIYTSGYYGRFQPLLKAEAGFGSLTHPDNFSGHFHDTRNIWVLGGGFEYHTWRSLWTRAEYDYEFFPDFHSSITGHNPALNPRGIIIGETWRFGPSGSHY